MRRVTGRGYCLAVVALVVLAACSGGGGGKAASNSSSASSDTTASDSTDSNTVVVGKTTFGPNDDDAIITKAVDVVQSFYEDQFPKLYGGKFAPVSGGLFPYGPTDPPPECGGPGLANYQDVAQNAFYCPPSDFVAWDTDNLTNDLLDNFGPYTLDIVVAHELGHAIQARHGILDGQFITFVTEQQADCFAGAFTQFVQGGGVDGLEVTPADLDNAIGGFLLIRDPVGTDTVNDESAHGSAFQRINAFQDGLEGGMEKCKTYEDLAINFVPEVFVPGSQDEAQQGNLPFNEVEPLVIANLEGFWTKAFNVIESGSDNWTTAKTNPFDPRDGVTCGNDTAKGDDAIGLAFYCDQDDTLNWDEQKLMPAVYTLGDLAESMIIANEYSERAQHLAGLKQGSLESRLQTDCFSGVWVATTKTDEINQSLPEDAQIQLSPGDLDEAVSAFLQLSKADAQAASESTAGTAFQHLTAFRAGFFSAFNDGVVKGLQTCLSDAPSSDASSS